MTANQLRYRELYTHLSDLKRAGLDGEGDTVAAGLRAELWGCWTVLTALERFPFLHPALLDRHQEGPVNRDFNHPARPRRDA